MSQPAEESVRDRVRRLAVRLEPQVNELARTIVERLRTEVPGFDRLPGDMRDVEIAATARQAVRDFLRYARDGPDAVALPGAAEPGKPGPRGRPDGTAEPANPDPRGRPDGTAEPGKPGPVGTARRRCRERALP
ncbi:hypothetical protein ACFYYR_04640 [Streptomyces sp. NPDC001922]|uniref:hypothetical protein n=1 Tax=Streptomyces sp. NPDC001922 TaxID=3364624 RepID=UPI0036942E2B